jgi:endonuclease/exonuclease/phosphatase family metal-dependent hydrolase
MRRSILAFLLAVLMVPVLLSSVPASAAKPAVPAGIAKVTATPGPGAGEITLRWSSSGKNTTGFILETALTSFSRTNASMARHGRRSRYTPLSGNRRSIVLTAAKVSSLGAGLASGNALFYRLFAVNKGSGGITTRAYPYLQAVLPRPAGPKAQGTRLRIASFNVRTARAAQDKRSWLRRAPDVAAEILSRSPGVLAIQELGPGRADGKKGTTKGTPRQTTSLESALARKGGQRYQLVRTTPYVAPGKPTATQGSRILYDTSRYTLLTRCPENTGKHAYSSSCTIQLPLLPGDSEKARRKGAMAEFRDRRTGKRFWFVSVHLDARHSKNAATEHRYDTLRWSQAKAIVPRVARFNKDRAQVIIGGDFNSWQNNRVGNSAHDLLIAQGFYDTSAAVTRLNFGYTTYTAFKKTVPRASQGLGVRLDMLFVKGARGAQRFENVMKVNDSSRPSDHNMILSDIVL